jgi:hypothetical protein
MDLQEVLSIIVLKKDQVDDLQSIKQATKCTPRKGPWNGPPYKKGFPIWFSWNVRYTPNYGNYFGINFGINSTT